PSTGRSCCRATRARGPPRSRSVPRPCRTDHTAERRSSAAATSASRATRRIAPRPSASCTTFWPGTCRRSWRGASDGSLRAATSQWWTAARRWRASRRCAPRYGRGRRVPTTGPSAAAGRRRSAPSSSSTATPMRCCTPRRAKPSRAGSVRSLRIWAPAAPLLLYLAAVLVQPSLYAVKLSFTDTLTGSFPTLANFRLIAGDGLFWRALAGNVLLPVAIVAVEVTGGLALAVLLAARLPGRRLLRAIVVIPFALPEVVFLTIRRFAFITLPLLRPALLSAVLLRGLDAVRVFATPLMLTGAEGLPVLSTYAYHQWSDYGNDGAAAAASSLLALLSVALTLPLLR